MTIGDLEVGYDRDRSSLIIVGKNDRCYYFVFEKLDKIYKPPDIPQYSEVEKEEFAEKHGDMIVKGPIRVRDIHKHRVSSTLVGIETATYQVYIASSDHVSLPLTSIRSGHGAALLAWVTALTR